VTRRPWSSGKKAAAMLGLPIKKCMKRLATLVNKAL
jgi:hypothetical protein